jgi:hypothetical protein
VKPGRVAWRARFLPDPGPKAPAMKDLLEGEADVRAGESIEIDLEAAR